MKKILVLFLCFMLMTTLSSCGLQKAIDRANEIADNANNNSEDKDSTEDEDSNNSDSDDNGNNNEDATTTEATQDTGDTSSNDNSGDTPSSSDFSDFATALTNFSTAYSDMKTPFGDIIDASPDNETYIMDALSFYTTDLNIGMVPLYDALDLTGTGGDKVTGTLMLSGFEGTKEKDGNLIKFGYNHTYEEDMGSNVKGDITKEDGYFDTKATFLKVKDTIESAGALAQRGDLEVLRLKDGTFIYQSYSYDSRGYSEFVAANFLIMNKDTLTFYSGTLEPSLDYTFKSMEGTQNANIDELSKDAKITFALRVKDGKVTFEKK